MKKVFIYLVRAGIVGFLLLLTICTAAYRLNPNVSPEVEAASDTSLKARFSDAMGSVLDNAGTVFGAMIGSGGMDLESYATVSHSGTYSDNGSEILSVEIPADKVSDLTSALSQELGTVIGADELVMQVSGRDGAYAWKNEDGSMVICVPENVYEDHPKDLLAYLCG